MDMSDDTGAGRALPRMMRRAGRIALTLAVIGAAVGAGISGYGVLAARASEADGPPAAPRTTVAPEILRLEDRVTLTRRFTGQFEAQQDVALGFEEGGTIAEVLVREGEAVAHGAVVAQLDTRLLEAERQRLVASRAALDAQAELARRTNARQMTLLSEGHVTQQRVDETSLQLAQLEASLAETDAGLAALEIRLSKAEIRAPFAGRVGARLLDAGAVAGPGAGVVTLLENGPARFRVALDPDLAAGLETGTEVDIETAGGRLAARLAELAPELDAATRSRVAYFDLLPGMQAPPARASGDVILRETRAERGVWVPLQALRPGPRGAWTLLVVDEERRIAVEAAEILHLAGDRAYVRGTFADGTHYLPEGTHRVVPGEVVTLAEAE
ncbi:efflux RND transporter periplasmic adaptor subunit [Roseibacterium sp. SDUM158016]|uniref:efflux RND transporter periplasmic adaptor subunit n=1 Tax=Roseicyclus sediminis TaxID=2980997 RepID=UPI0021D02C3D|nr:efflux RND transporter periplasmic adaptor subunit [Roseibacterium sp. SDUM158016]MCU4653242.1 efflux RND transporter periplasmic adaptor subunit [Roseibacterium sp. SDUM158016]